MKGRLFGVGVGPGDPELMTYKAVRTIEKCPVIAAKEMFGIQGKVLEDYGLPLYPDQLDEGRGK